MPLCHTISSASAAPKPQHSTPSTATQSTSCCSTNHLRADTPAPAHATHARPSTRTETQPHAALSPATATTTTTLANVYTSLFANAQYRRTYAQGCACSTGLAGGGCCPSGSTTIGAHTGCTTGSWQHLWHSVGGLLGAFGIYSGVQVIRNSLDAIYHLQRMQQSVQQKTTQLRAILSGTERTNLTASLRQNMAQHLGAQTILQHNLQASLREQYFNFAFPGMLQLCTGGAALAAAALGYAGIPGLHLQARILAPALLGVYGLGMAARQFFELRAQYALARKATPIAAQMAQHLNAHRHALWHGLGAWSSIGVLGLFATINLIHPLGLPIASGAFVGAALGCALWAMYSSSQTRFVPHIPLSHHVAPQWLADSRTRYDALERLREQDTVIQNTVAHWTQQQSLWIRLQLYAERTFKPQCGPTSNRVLPYAMGQAGTDVAFYQTSQIQAAQAWCTQEQRFNRSLYAQLAASGLQDDVLLKQHVAERLTCCERGDKRSMQTDIAHELLDAQRLRHQLLDRIRALDALMPVLAQLLLHAGEIQTPTPEMKQDSMHWQWFFARLCLLQLSGTLASALPENFTQQHASLLTTIATSSTWPIDNIALLPEHLWTTAALLAPHMDYGFVHAFFNPRRIEAERDYLNEWELMLLRHPQEALHDAAITAPACGDRSCCA